MAYIDRLLYYLYFALSALIQIFLNFLYRLKISLNEIQADFVFLLPQLLAVGNNLFNCI